MTEEQGEMLIGILESCEALLRVGAFAAWFALGWATWRAIIARRRT
jgi:hypothetical protein